MKWVQVPAMVNCPECDFQLELKAELKRGDQLVCPNCRSLLVVLRVDPLELDWAFQAPLTDPTDKARPG